ncbi:MAG: phosphoribulokinase [Pseudonocardia sp.]
MADKAFRMARAARMATGRRPVMLAIAGDSAAGKTTLTRGLVDVLGRERCLSICVDDYHRYDRQERSVLPFTALHPHCNHLDIMEQHLQLLATGQPILKPVYDHSTGLLARPELVEPHEFVIVEGLLPLHSKLARACFDVTVYLDPPEEVRRGWKIARDTRQRGYAASQVHAELQRREPDSEAFIRPQRGHADIVVCFAPIAGRDDPPDTPLSAELVLRPTIRHPDLTGALDPPPRAPHVHLARGRIGALPAHSAEQVAVTEVLRSEQHAPGRAIHLKLGRDTDGRPVDTLHVHGYVPPEQSRDAQRAIWALLGERGDPPAVLGRVGHDRRSEPLAIAQLLLLYHLLDAAR